ncbi:tumor necrosis factor a (TNF superfamily, member 2) [Trichomycterus rosablanca]|uniref:tumor necrosis factor a (TNF superfamily, member 2) n=1 Tax=Trichomycterus rosablanca TaxID=2290929 RepID=UPI002F357644
MDSDKMVVLDMDGPRVTVSREKVASGPGWWRSCGVLLLVALCTAAAVCFSVSRIQTRADETDFSSTDIKHSLRQISQTARAAIYLSGTYNSSIHDSVQWEEDADQGFSEGLKLVNNQILIPRTGIYFVYSQATYRLKCTADSEDDDGQMLHISHSVRRRSDSFKDWMPLLNGARTACKKTPDDKDEYWYGAVYLGAAFRLNAGDQLKTFMNAKLLPSVEDEAGKTFFGVFAL